MSLPPSDVVLKQLTEGHRWKMNEATMVANLLVPLLARMCPAGVRLEAECRVQFQFGTNVVQLDTLAHSRVCGRADFFIRDHESGKILIAIEAKEPGDELTDADLNQLRSYMRAALPLVPFGVVCNGSGTPKLFGWQGGDIIEIDPSGDHPLASFPGELDAAIKERAAQILLSLSPAYRDNVMSAVAESELKLRGRPSEHPRSLVHALVASAKGTVRSVNLIAAPPGCGKSQILLDLAHLYADAPIIYATSTHARGGELNKLVDKFRLAGTAVPPIIDYLKARSNLGPVHILIDSKVASQDVRSLLSFMDQDRSAKVHLYIAASYQVIRELLYWPDFAPRLHDSAAITVYEMGSFSDEELELVYPGINVSLISAPYWRLVRWPTLHDMLGRKDLESVHLGDILVQWFEQCPRPVNDAMLALGESLAKTTNWGAKYLPLEFCNHAQALEVLLACGFVVEVPSKRSGIRHYALACIEIGMHALLAHIFDFPGPPRGGALDNLVAKWREESSDEEMIALITLLPTFLSEPKVSNTIDRIVRYMLQISFGSYVLEGMSRSGVYAAFEREFTGLGLQRKNPFGTDASEILRDALLTFREKVGLMPSFRELEHTLFTSFRSFGDRKPQLERLNMSLEEFQDEDLLAQLGTMMLSDILFLFSEGDVSWLPGQPDRETICAIARAVVRSLGDAHRKLLPVESKLDYLEPIITRQHPRDLYIMLRQRAHRNELLELDGCVERAVERTLEVYAHGAWEILADCFAYLEAMSPGLRHRLVDGLIKRGSDMDFARVFINHVESQFAEFLYDERESILNRLLTAVDEEPQIAVFFRAACLKAICSEHPETFSGLRQRMEKSSNPVILLRLWSIAPPSDATQRNEELTRILLLSEVGSLCSIIAMPEFRRVCEGLGDPAIYFNSIGERDGSAEQQRTARLVVQLLSLLEWNGQPLAACESYAELHGMMESLIERAPALDGGATPKGVGWSQSRCEAAIEAYLKEELARKNHAAVDRVLRAALLNVHDSAFNRHFVRAAVDATRWSDGEYRRRVLMRLIASGFDLWVVRIDRLHPMLSMLLDDVLRAAGEERRGLMQSVANWLVRHRALLDVLPNFATYSIDQIFATEGLCEAVSACLLERIEDGEAGIGIILGLMDLLKRVGSRHVNIIAGWIDELCAGDDDLRRRFMEDYDLEWKWWRSVVARDGDVGESDEQHTEDINEQTVLEAFNKAIAHVPQLPRVLPKWASNQQKRSMLAAIPGGYCRWSIEDFRDNL